MTPRVIWYLILFGCDILTIVLMILHSIKDQLFIDNCLLNINFWVLLGGLIYWGYMMLSEMAESGESNKGTETFLGGERTQFMTDTLFKYIFSIVIGITLVNGLFTHSFGNSLFENIQSLYTNYLFPAACIAEIFLRNRNRSPAPVKDIIILLIIFGVSFVLHFLKQFSFKFLTDNLALYICQAIGVIIAYFLYDILVYIKIQGTWAGYTFLSSN